MKTWDSSLHHYLKSTSDKREIFYVVATSFRPWSFKWRAW